jgi:hypothetical protein
MPTHRDTEIEARAASAHEHWVGSEGLSFRGRDDAERLGDVVKFHWEAVAKDGEAFGVGLNFLVLVADGRIERDYTFVVAWGDGRRFIRRAGRECQRRPPRQVLPAFPEHARRQTPRLRQCSGMTPERVSGVSRFARPAR